MEFKRILKSSETGNRLVFGMTDSDLVLIANCITGKLQLAEMGAEDIDTDTQAQMHTILNEFSKAIAEDENGNV